MDYIDTSVWIGSFVEDETVCNNYLRRVGYKTYNLGVVHHFVLSEIMVDALIDIRGAHPQFDQSLREEIIGSVMKRMNFLREAKRMRILKIEEIKINERILDELQGIENKLSYDDALHLHMAIKSGCKRFVTTDELFNRKNKSKGSKVLLDFLKKKYNLKVKHLDKG